MIFVYCLFFSILFTQQPIDAVVVVVGKKPILHSEVLQQSQIIAASKNINPLNSPYAFQKIYDKTLDQIINQYVIIDVAEQDTTIIIKDKEIDRVLNERINEFILQAGSKDKFEEMVGMPMRKIKSEYWGEIKNMLYVEKFKYNNVQNINISRQEVELFYQSFKDSIPMIPEYYNFSVIDIPFEASKKTKELTVSILDSLKKTIINNENSFEEVAKTFSDDPGSSYNGGYLGFTMRGNLLLEYEEAAYSLDINEISSPVETEFGFHLIKLLEKRGEKISTQHILKTISFSKEDIMFTKNKINSIIKTVSNDPFVFDSLSVEYQNKYKNFSGKYEKLTPLNISPILLNEIKNIKNYTLSPPIQTNDGYLLIYLYDYKKEYKPSIKNSWPLIEQYALQEKQNRIFNNTLELLKKETYIKKY